MINEELETSKARIERMIDVKLGVVSQVALQEHRGSVDVFTAKDMMVELLEEMDDLDGALSDLEKTPRTRSGIAVRRQKTRRQAPGRASQIVHVRPRYGVLGAIVLEALSFQNFVLRT